jgi:cell division protein FtsB
MAEPTGHEELTDCSMNLMTSSTSGGVKERGCPCCKKKFKMERLGGHFKKIHPTEYYDLFKVPDLSASIENKGLVGFTVVYEECDTKFLHCLSCLSVRTTDRNHFEKNPTHLAEHIEIAEKMIAKKTGVKYINPNVTAVEKLQRDLEKVKRELKLKQKECHEEHGQYDTYILLKTKENDTLTARNEELEAELKELKMNFESRGNRIEYLEKNIKVFAPFIKSAQDDLEGLYSHQNETKFNSCNMKLASAYKWCVSTLNS